MPAFVNAVLKEARYHRDRIPSRPKTIYLGGGTPTALSESHLERLLAGLLDVFQPSQLAEFCIEANPRTITASKAAMMRSIGVSRVSLGVQAWDEATLKTLGRDHNPLEAEKTFHELRSAGFPSLNVDLMFSIPGQSIEQWIAGLGKTIALRPDHVSVYNLNYEEDTEFFERLVHGRYRENPERDAEFFFTALDMLNAAGFLHYEISNYAQPGHHSAHNESYWFGEDYLGLGPSAFSTHASKRWQNVCDTGRYIQLALSDQPAAINTEEITPEKRRIERFGLELRTSRGLPIDQVATASQPMLTTLAREGLLEIKGSFVRLTRAGKPLVDSVAVALLG